MNGNGVSGAHGPGLNGAGDFYYEAVEGAQSPGGLLLSPAAFINPAQYASVLEGRFKQLQGERPRPGAPGTEGPEQSRGGTRRLCRETVCAGTDYEGPNPWAPAESGKAWAPLEEGT